MSTLTDHDVDVGADAISDVEIHAIEASPGVHPRRVLADIRRRSPVEPRGPIQRGLQEDRGIAGSLGRGVIRSGIKLAQVGADAAIGPLTPGAREVSQGALRGLERATRFRPDLAGGDQGYLAKGAEMVGGMLPALPTGGFAPLVFGLQAQQDVANEIADVRDTQGSAAVSPGAELAARAGGFGLGYLGAKVPLALSGSVATKAVQAGLNPLARYGLAAGATTAELAAQNPLQVAASNILAQHTYDPTRPTWLGAGEAAAMAPIVGPVFALGSLGASAHAAPREGAGEAAARPARVGLRGGRLTNAEVEALDRQVGGELIARQERKIDAAEPELQARAERAQTMRAEAEARQAEQVAARAALTDRQITEAKQREAEDRIRADEDARPAPAAPAPEETPQPRVTVEPPLGPAPTPGKLVDRQIAGKLNYLSTKALYDIGREAGLSMSGGRNGYIEALARWMRQPAGQHEQQSNAAEVPAQSPTRAADDRVGDEAAPARGLGAEQAVPPGTDRPVEAGVAGVVPEGRTLQPPGTVAVDVGGPGRTLPEAGGVESPTIPKPESDSSFAPAPASVPPGPARGVGDYVPTKPAKRYSKLWFVDQLYGYGKDKGYISNDLNDLANHPAIVQEYGGPRDMGDPFSFKGDLPGEVKDYLRDNPGDWRLFKPHKQYGAGRDIMLQLGDRYWDLVREAKRGKTRAVEEFGPKLGQMDDPNAVLLWQIYKNIPKDVSSKELGLNKTVERDPKTIPVNHEWEWGGHKYRIEADENGYRLLRNGDEFDPIPVDAVDSVPMKEGTLKPIPAAEQAPESGPAAKEPWQMTRAELEKSMGRGHFQQARKNKRAIDFEALHREAVEQAAKEGKPVPPEVLADYPDQAKSAEPELPPPAKSAMQTDLYGNSFIADSGIGEQKPLFHEPVQVPRPETAKVGSESARDPRHTAEMFRTEEPLPTRPDDDIPFSLRAEANARGVDRAELDRAFELYRRRFPGIKLRAISRGELPERARTPELRGRIEEMVDGGAVLVVAENLDSITHGLDKAWHGIVGHIGADATLEPKHLAAAWKYAETNEPELVKFVRDNYAPGRQLGEAVARLSERFAGQPRPKWYQNLLSVIRFAWRRLTGRDYDLSDIERIVQRSRRAAERLRVAGSDAAMSLSDLTEIEEPAAKAGGRYPKAARQLPTAGLPDSIDGPPPGVNENPPSFSLSGGLLDRAAALWPHYLSQDISQKHLRMMAERLAPRLGVSAPDLLKAFRSARSAKFGPSPEDRAAASARAKAENAAKAEREQREYERTGMTPEQRKVAQEDRARTQHQEVYDELIRRGAKLRAESSNELSDSLYFELNGQHIRLSDHTANDATQNWLDRVGGSNIVIRGSEQWAGAKEIVNNALGGAEDAVRKQVRRAERGVNPDHGSASQQDDGPVTFPFDTVPVPQSESQRRLAALERGQRVDIDPTGLGPASAWKAFRIKAIKAYRSLVEATVRSDGRTVEFKMGGFDKLQSHSADKRTMEIIPALKKLMEESTPLYESPPSPTDRDKNVKLWRTYGALGRLHGVDVMVKLVVKDYGRGKLVLDVFHDAHVLSVLEMEQGSLPPASRNAMPALGEANPARNKLLQWYRAVKAIPLEDIRFSLSGGPRAGIRLTPESALGTIRRKAQDEFLRLEQAQKDIAEQGGKVDESTDVYTKANLYGSRAAAQIAQVERDFVDPIVQTAAKAGFVEFANGDIGAEGLPSLREYLTALHAPSRNRVIRERDPNNPAGSGMTDAEAGKIVRDVLSSPQAQAYKEIADRVHAMNRQTLKLELDSGLIDRPTYDRWTTQWDNYVPLRTDMEGEHPGGNLRRGRGFSLLGREHKSALGRGDASDDPLTFSIMQANEKIVRAEKNQVGQSLLKLVEDNAADLSDIMRIVPHPTQRVLKAGEVATGPDPMFRLKDNVVSVKRDGKETLIEMVGPEGALFARAFKRLGVHDGGKAIRVIGGAMRVMRSVNTNLNPEFVIPNILRDLQMAGINLTVEESAGMAKGAVLGWKKAAKAVWDVAKNHDAKPGEKYHDYAREWIEHGGKIDVYRVQDFTDTQESLLGKLHDIDPTLRRRAWNLGRSALRYIDRINGAAENAIRLSAYVEARTRGMSPQRASLLAKDLTVNFTRKGEWGNTLNTLYMFYNASAQGGVRTAKVIARTRNSNVARAVVGGAIFGGYLNSLIMRAILGKDEQGRDIYDTTSDEERDANILFPGGFKMPLPYGFNTLWSVGRNIADVIHGPKTVGQAALSVGNSAVGSFSPFGHVGTPLQAVAPTALDPAAQVYENRNWRGEQLRPEQNPFGPAEPDSELFDRRQSKLSVEIARFLNRVTGGDKVTPGGIDVNPATLDVIAETVLGGLGRFGAKAAKLPGRLADEDLRYNQIPIASRFLYQQPQGINSDEFYESLRSIQQTRAREKYYREQQDLEKYRELRREHAIDFQTEEAAKIAEKRVRELKRRRDAAANPKAYDEAIEREMGKFNRYRRQASSRTPTSAAQ